MVLRLVALSSSGFSEVVIDDAGNVKFSGPDLPDMAFLDGLGWALQDRDLPDLNRRDCLCALPNGQGLGSPPSVGSLFHYTTVDSALKILETGTLRLSPYAGANDDYECTTRWFDFYCSDEEGPPGIAIEESKKLNHALRDYWAFASFSTDQLEWSTASIIDINDSDGWQHPGMWAYYGGRHRASENRKFSGAVLVFERRALIDAALRACCGKVLIFGNVRYSDSNDEITLSSHRINFDEYKLDGIDKFSEKYFLNYWRELHLTKFAGWSHEKEARIAINTSSDSPCFIPFGESLTHILVGEGATANQIDDIEKLAASHKIEAKGVRWRNGMPISVPLSLLPR